MRKFKRFPPRTLRFRSLLILAGAFALLAAFTPRANAALIRYYNMEGAEHTALTPLTWSPICPRSRSARRRRYSSTMEHLGSRFPASELSPEPGLPANIAPGDPAANLNSIGFTRSGQSNLGVEIPLPSPSWYL